MMVLKAFIAGCLFLTACGEGANSGAIKYYLQRAATATTVNQLRLETQGPFQPKFSISGTMPMMRSGRSTATPTIVCTLAVLKIPRC